VGGCTQALYGDIEAVRAARRFASTGMRLQMHKAAVDKTERATREAAEVKVLLAERQQGHMVRHADQVRTLPAHSGGVLLTPLAIEEEERFDGRNRRWVCERPAACAQGAALGRALVLTPSAAAKPAPPTHRFAR